MDQPVFTSSNDAQSPETANQWLLAIGRNADKTAFVALFNYFAPRVKAYLRRQGLNNEAAEDIAQDVMLQVWNRAGQYDPAKARASTWIFTIARNRLIDVWRQNKNAPAEMGDLELAASQSYEPQAEVERAEDGAAVRAALNELPAPQRELVEESFLRERSHHMIAEARKIPLGTVKSRLRLALDRLRKNMADKNSPPRNPNEENSRKKGQS